MYQQHAKRHAFLIIAHNEFEVLQHLIDCLDSDRTDIYVHIDKKVKVLPVLHTNHSKLYVLNNRIDVRWGHVSQIECELLLFEVALKNGPYHHYHLLSGTHLPLRPLDELLAFYEKHEGEEFMDIWGTCKGRDNIKLGRYNFLIRNFKCKSQLRQRIIQFIWTANLKVQKILGIYRNPDEEFLKASQWVSLTQEAIKYLCNYKEQIRQKYRFTLCSDEYFVATELSHAGFTVFNYKKLLFQKWQGESPRVLTEDDYDEIVASGCMYARKFTYRQSTIVCLIIPFRNDI